MTEETAMRISLSAREKADTLSRRLSAARRLHQASARFTDSECEAEAALLVSGLEESLDRAREAVAWAENRLAQIRAAKQLGIAS